MLEQKDPGGGPRCFGGAGNGSTLEYGSRRNDHDHSRESDANRMTIHLSATLLVLRSVKSVVQVFAELTTSPHKVLGTISPDATFLV